jgi:hypothetical protein
MRLRAYAGALTATALLVGCHSGANATIKTGATATSTSVPSAPTATRPGRPACTQPAVLEAAQQSAAAYGLTITDLQSFHCSGDFAYAFADEQQQGNVNSVTLLFKASGTRWVPVDRGTYCQNGSVPKAIYANACETQ